MRTSGRASRADQDSIQSSVPVCSVPLIWTLGAYVKMLLQCFSSVSESKWSDCVAREASVQCYEDTLDSPDVQVTAGEMLA